MRTAYLLVIFLVLLILAGTVGILASDLPVIAWRVILSAAVMILLPFLLIPIILQVAHQREVRG